MADPPLTTAITAAPNARPARRRRLNLPPLRRGLPQRPISVRAEVNSAAPPAREGLHGLRGRRGAAGQSPSAPLGAVPPPRGASASRGDAPPPPRGFASPARFPFPPSPFPLALGALRPPPPALPRIPPTRRESCRPPRRSDRSAPRPRRTAPRSLPPS